MSSPTLPSTLLARDGVTLHVSQWPVSRPRGVVQLIHGFGEHTGRYGEVAAALNAQGWTVAAIDHRGHGLSAGPRGGLAQDDDLLHDQAALYDAVSAIFPDAPLRLLFGNSMGGLVAARLASALAQSEESPSWARHFDGVVLVAPVLQPDMNFTQRALLSSFGRLAPDLAVSAGFKLEWVSSDPQVIAQAYLDPLIHDRITARLTYFMLNAGEVVLGSAPHWKMPTLMLYSQADRLCLAHWCERLAAALPPKLVAAHDYVTLAHDLLHEPERQQVFDRISQWLNAKFPAAMYPQEPGALRAAGG